MKLFYSNRFEILYHYFQKNLFQNQNPFFDRWVIVPSLAVKSWLTLNIATDLGIASGFRFYYLDEALSLLNRKNGAEYQNQITKLELSFIIEKKLENKWHTFCSLDSEKQQIWLPIIDYIQKEGDTLTKKGKKRIISISNKLAEIFFDYAMFGQNLTLEWEQTDYTVHWQADLWKNIFDDESKIPFYHLRSSVNIAENKEIHIIGLNYLSPLQYQFLLKAGSTCQIYFYILSPCPLYWDDISNDFQDSKLLQFLRKKGIKQLQEQALSSLLENKNRLLANYGKLGKNFLSIMAQDEHEVVEKFVLPFNPQELPFYEDFVREDDYFDHLPITALSVIQMDLTLLINSLQRPKINLKVDDKSVQIHEVNSKLREIEVVYDAILQILDEDKSIKANQITILAPNIQDYAPYIEYVFNQDKQILDYQIMDIEEKLKNHFLDGVILLFELGTSRWESHQLLKLFENPFFLAKQKWKQDDLYQIKEWILETDIRWGRDGDHRNEIIVGHHENIKNEYFNNFQTWKDGIDKLLNSLIYSQSLDNPFQIKKIELLGEWINLITQLFEDLSPIRSSPLNSLSNWVKYIQNLIHKYFECSMESSYDKIIVLLNQMERSDRYLEKDDLYPFDSVFVKFKQNIGKKDYIHKENHLHAVKFCSMLPMRTLPSAVIILMGLEENKFPKQSFSSPLDLLSKYKGNKPNQTDIDRYLFLETILSARQYLILTYINSATQYPAQSIILSDLIAYLDGSVCYEGKKFSQIWFIKHLASPYESFYFFNHYLKSYSRKHWQTLQWKMNSKIEKPFFKKIVEGELEFFEEISIQELIDFAKNPLKYFFNKKLEIYLLQDNQIKNEENFLITPMQLGLLRKRGAFEESQTIIETANKMGLLNKNIFTPIIEAKIVKEIDNLCLSRELFNISKDNLIEILFTEEPKDNTQKQIFLPPLTINTLSNKSVKITGKLFPFCSEGFIVNSKDTFQDLLKVWPHYLLFLKAKKDFQLNIEENIIFLRSSTKKKIEIENVNEMLANYLSFYFKGTSEGTLVIPDWALELGKYTPGNEIEIFEQFVNDPFYPCYNEYLKWIFRFSKPTANDIANAYEEYKEVYENIYDLWAQK